MTPDTLPNNEGKGRPRLFTEHASLRSVQMTVQHRHLRAALMQIYSVSDNGEGAFNARLKHIFELGLIPDNRPEKKGWRTYSFIDALEISLCLQLQRSFVPPAIAVRFIVEHREQIDHLWKVAADKDCTILSVEVDAFAAIGGVGREKGRGSRGNETGTIRILPELEASASALGRSSLALDLSHIITQILAQLGKSVINDVKDRMARLKTDRRDLD